MGPWTDDGKTDPQTNQPSGFAPPVPFVDEDGSDLGVLVAEIDGSGRTAILQSDVRAGQPARAAYFAGAKSYEPHPEYMLPSSFVITRDGKTIANYRLAKWTGGPGPDLIYETDSDKGFLQNRGQGTGLGWNPLNFPPPISLGPATHLIDLDCSGGPPALVGPVTESGTANWQVWRFVDTSTGWRQDKDLKWIRLFLLTLTPRPSERFDLAGRLRSVLGSSCPRPRLARTSQLSPPPVAGRGRRHCDLERPARDLIGCGRAKSPIWKILHKRRYWLHCPNIVRSAYPVCCFGQIEN